MHPRRAKSTPCESRMFLDEVMSHIEIQRDSTRYPAYAEQSEAAPVVRILLDTSILT